MYTKSELESMTFKELKRLAREKSISHCWTCKREAVNHLMRVGHEDLNMDSVTLVDSPHLRKKSRFPKPRMTVFQENKDDSSFCAAEYSRKGKQKYFATPNELRKIKVNENLRGSTRKPAFEVVSSREKSVGVTDLFLEETSIGKMAVRGVTLRELGRPLTRSYKNRFLQMDLLQSGEEYNTVADQTIHISEKRNSNSGGMSKDTRLKLDKSVPVSGTTQGIANELKYTLSCGREKQMNPFTGEVKITSGARMEDACFTLKLEAWKSDTDTEESSPKCNLNETFQIKNETPEATPPLRMQGCNKTSTPTDDTDDKENEISDYGCMNTTFELPHQSNATLFAYDVEDNQSGRKKGSFSCPYEGTDKEGLSTALVLNGTAKLTTPSESCLHPKRGTPLKGTKIPKLVKKMPDFTNIHKREFEKMESVIDNHQRKLDRAKMLLCSKPSQHVQTLMLFTAQLPAANQVPSHNPMTQNSVLPTNQRTRNVPQTPAGDRKILQHTRAYNKQRIQRHDIKQMITQKIPLQNIERVREETRTVIRGVRLNRRFDLQMAHRKIN